MHGIFSSLYTEGKRYWDVKRIRSGSSAHSLNLVNSNQSEGEKMKETGPYLARDDINEIRDAPTPLIPNLNLFHGRMMVEDIRIDYYYSA